MGLAWHEPAARGPRDYFESPVIVLLGLTFMLHIWWAYALPMTNDEAYYWDWGQSLQLSYYDHPPGVSYLTWLSSKLFHGNLAARALSPILYLGSLLFALGSLCRIHGASTERLVTALDARRSASTLVLLATLVPGLSLWGSIALPDTGLMFGLSVTTYLSLRFMGPDRLNIGQGILFGLALGISGLFKYHALPIAGGIAFGLWLVRWRQAKNISWGFWITTIIVGFYCCMPVWLWNVDNDFASIRFQANHGFADPKFHLTWGLRILAAQVVLLGGIYWWRALLFLKEVVKHASVSRTSAIGFFAAFPLLLLLTVTSFWKELLPHWLLPAFWVLLPFVVAAFPRRWPRLQWILSTPLAFLILFFSFDTVRTRLLTAMNGRPGPMSELTIWPPMAAQIYSLWSSSSTTVEDRARGCDEKPYLAGLRWYSVAQLRFHLPGQPKVFSLDPNHTSYYNARDPEGGVHGCPLWVFAPEKNLDDAALAERIEVIERSPLVVEGHEATPWVFLKGLFR